MPAFEAVDDLIKVPSRNERLITAAKCTGLIRCFTAVNHSVFLLERYARRARASVAEIGNTETKRIGAINAPVAIVIDSVVAVQFGRHATPHEHGVGSIASQVALGVVTKIFPRETGKAAIGGILITAGDETAPIIGMDVDREAAGVFLDYRTTLTESRIANGRLRAISVNRARRAGWCCCDAASFYNPDTVVVDVVSRQDSVSKSRNATAQRHVQRLGDASSRTVRQLQPALKQIVFRRPKISEGNVELRLAETGK